jgi:putative GTP pyrophosphokinase
MTIQEMQIRNDSQDLNQCVSEYTKLKPCYEEFTGKLKNLIEELLRAHKIETQLIESRTKGIESFKEKISSPSKRYVNPINEVTDLSGIRIIVYYEEDLDTVCKLINDEFEIDKINSIDKRNILKPEQFGYQSIHFVVKISNSRCDLTEWNHLAKFNAEIQVRTVLQHAWAAISHKLQYKREEDVPLVLRRRLYRLSALLELADEQFVSLRNKTKTLTQEIGWQILDGETVLEINLLTVEEFLRTSLEVQQLVKEAKKSGFSFENFKNEKSAEMFSEFIIYCNIAGIASISSLKTVIEKSLTWSQSYLETLKIKSGTPWEVSPGFICVLIIIKTFSDKFTADVLNNLGWSENIASCVLS